MFLVSEGLAFSGCRQFAAWKWNGLENLRVCSLVVVEQSFVKLYAELWWKLLEYPWENSWIKEGNALKMLWAKSLRNPLGLSCQKTISGKKRAEISQKTFNRFSQDNITQTCSSPAIKAMLKQLSQGVVVKWKNINKPFQVNFLYLEDSMVG